MALTASLGAPGSAGRPAYPANDIMARAGGDVLTPLAGWAGWPVVPDLAMSGIVIPTTARTITAITRKRALMLSQPVCVRSSCMSTCHSCGHPVRRRSCAEQGARVLNKVEAELVQPTDSRQYYHKSLNDYQ